MPSDHSSVRVSCQDGASATAGPHPLVYIARSSSAPAVPAQSGAVWRFALQAAARDLMPGERVGKCLRWPYASRVGVMAAPARRAACYQGLQTCGSVWMCPVCASKVSERRRLDLGQGVKVWQNLGGQVALVTYTIRHKQADDLRISLEGLLSARAAMVSGRAAAAAAVRFGLAGSVRALEVTHGGNGWHPHLHELLFVAGGIDLAELGRNISERWAVVVEQAGLRSVNKHGVRLDKGDWSVAEYVAKFGHERTTPRTWGLEHELAKAVSKRGRDAGRSPSDLLAAYAAQGDQVAGSLWQQYAYQFKGRRQLVWSTRLRLRLGLAVEKTDEQIAAEVQDFYSPLVWLSLAQWRQVVGNDARAEVLDVAKGGDIDRLCAYLEGLGVYLEQAQKASIEQSIGAAA